MAKKDRALFTLDKILGTINRDVNRIQKMSYKEKLSSTDAGTLTKYATTLSAIAEAREKERNKNKKKLDNLSTEELIEMYKKEPK